MTETGLQCELQYIITNIVYQQIFLFDLDFWNNLANVRKINKTL